MLMSDLSIHPLRAARDPFGRSVWLDGQFLALQLMDRKDARFVPLARLLRKALSARGNADHKALPALPRILVDAEIYQKPQRSAPSSQRLFLMESLEEMHIDGVNFPELPALRLGTEYISSSQPRPVPSTITKTNIPGVWQMGSRKLGAVYLFRQEKLISDLEATCKLNEVPSPGAFRRIEPPGQGLSTKAAHHFPPSARALSRLALAWYLDGPDPFAAATDQRNAVYLWTAVAGIALIAVLAMGLASLSVGRQMRLTRLKNDLIATVSHELKTPLASMRVLVDTLREGRCTDDKQAGEYFDLIARENERLSRLIDNFLTFSRMERNKRAFDFAEMDVGEVGPRRGRRRRRAVRPAGLEADRRCRAGPARRPRRPRRARDRHPQPAGQRVEVLGRRQST